MPLSVADLYNAHVLNLRAVQAGIVRIERELRAAIARQDQPSSETLLNILLLLTGAWAECRLRKLLYEPSGFDDVERATVLNSQNQIASWQCALELGYRKRYGVPTAALSERTLSHTAWMRYRAIYTLIDTELRPIIEMRNTLAHGQWSRPLNSAGNDVVGTMIAAMKRENALTSRFKFTLLEALANLVHDLVSSVNAFERDYDVHYKHIVDTRRDLQTRDYGRWIALMVDKYKRGQAQRRTQIDLQSAWPRQEDGAVVTSHWLVRWLRSFC